MYRVHRHEQRSLAENFGSFVALHGWTLTIKTFDDRYRTQRTNALATRLAKRLDIVRSGIKTIRRVVASNGTTAAKLTEIVDWISDG